MMSKTHVSIGMASALGVSLLDKSGMASILLAMAGGVLGAVTPDVDTLKNDYHADALIGQGIALGIIIIVLGIDYVSNIGIMSDILMRSELTIIGIIVFAVIYVIGFFCNHREFTHSLLAFVIFSVSISIISLPLGGYYAVGYLSHLVIDLLNKKGMRLLYPLKCKPCLKICCANKNGNKILMFFGLGASVLLLIMNIVK